MEGQMKRILKKSVQISEIKCTKFPTYMQKKRMKKFNQNFSGFSFQRVILRDYVFLLDTGNFDFYLVQLFTQFMRFMIHFDDNNGNVVQFSFGLLSAFKVCSDSIRFDRMVFVESAFTLICMNLELVVGLFHFLRFESSEKLKFLLM